MNWRSCSFMTSANLLFMGGIITPPTHTVLFCVCALSIVCVCVCVLFLWDTIKSMILEGEHTPVSDTSTSPQTGEWVM